ncbi:hypothetical protein ABZS59_30685 [Streptomyces flaveolus]|jgi:ATP-dependent DNA ligase|uniref:ATP-dependent DNA ligase n=1 Tax=Streptomyces flaveolus TaxID=67297 RepID=UPI0033A7F8D3
MMLQVRACRRDAGARQAARTAPAHLMVFDVLVTADGPLLDEPYRVRRALPEALFRRGGVVAAHRLFCVTTTDRAARGNGLDGE